MIFFSIVKQVGWMLWELLLLDVHLNMRISMVNTSSFEVCLSKCARGIEGLIGAKKSFFVPKILLNNEL